MKHPSSNPIYKRGFAAGKRAAKRELRQLMATAPPATHVDLPKFGEASVKAEGGVTVHDLPQAVAEWITAHEWIGS